MTTLEQFKRNTQSVIRGNEIFKFRVLGLEKIDSFWYYKIRHWDDTEMIIPKLNTATCDVPHWIELIASRSYTTPQVRVMFGIGEKWDFEEYSHKRSPIQVFDNLWDRRGIQSPMPNVVNLPIRIPNNDKIYLPLEYEGVSEIVSRALAYERAINPYYHREYYVYLTVNESNTELETQKGYQIGDLKDMKENLRTEHTYIISDSLATKFNLEGFHLDGTDIETSTKSILDNLSQFNPDYVYYTKPYELILYDTYQLHKDVLALMNTVRKNVKITLSTQQLNVAGYGINPSLPIKFKYESKIPIQKEPFFYRRQ